MVRSHNSVRGTLNYSNTCNFNYKFEFATDKAFCILLSSSAGVTTSAPGAAGSNGNGNGTAGSTPSYVPMFMQVEELQVLTHEQVRGLAGAWVSGHVG